MSSNKWPPLLLIVLGGVLFSVMVVFSIFGFPQSNSKQALALPLRLGGLSLSTQTTGSAAISEFTGLHGKSLAVTRGVKGVYGERGEVTVWVAEAETEDAARQLLMDMAAKIAEAGRLLFRKIPSS